MNDAHPSGIKKPTALPRQPFATAESEAVRSDPAIFAAQELRLTSALVMLLGLGLFLALPFVLSIGSVVFLPPVSGG